jgi:transposase InsO family protein
VEWDKVNGLWVEPDVRDKIVDYIERMKTKTGIKMKGLIEMVGISQSKYYSWKYRDGKPNRHNGKIPKSHWIRDWEREKIVSYAKSHENEGYRRLTYMMMDEDIVFVSPATTYRALLSEGLLERWNKAIETNKGKGFEQPKKVHEHWHIDIKYVNFLGTFLFLISIIDGYSRYIVHHELRMNMQEYDVEITLQRAIEKFPNEKPRIISDNGSQFVSKDFHRFLSIVELDHIRTSIAYPQSNGKIERFHKTIHEECLSKRSMIDIDDARRQINNYIEFYNTKRLHSALYYLTPNDFLLGKVSEKLKVRMMKLQNARIFRGYENSLN